MSHIYICIFRVDQLCRQLINLLQESRDPTVLAVAVHDVGMYVKYCEKGKQLVMAFAHNFGTNNVIIQTCNGIGSKDTSDGIDDTHRRGCAISCAHHRAATREPALGEVIFWSV